MDENRAQELISTNFPELTIKEIKKIGEGTGNVAYEINTDFVFRFPKKPENQKQLEQEISFQEILKNYSSLPIPEFKYLPNDHSFVGYQKLLGTPLLYIHEEFKGWDNFSQQIGDFLTKLHTIPTEKLRGLNLLTENKTFEDWQKYSYPFYEKTRYLIPGKYISGIERYFQSTPQGGVSGLVFCHNDLGIEHILISENEVSGIIDWGGVALTDPASDFARIYRDVGEKAIDGVLAVYMPTQINKKELRDRAMFYGKCLIFEDLFCGIRDDVYLQKSLAALEWMF